MRAVKMLENYKSQCQERQKIIVSRDRKSGNQSEHKADNKKKDRGRHYCMDDDNIIENSVQRCDYLLLNDDKKRAYFIELKGKAIEHAKCQIESAERLVAEDIEGYTRFYRIVYRARTQNVRSSDINTWIERCGKVESVKVVVIAKREYKENIDLLNAGIVGRRNFIVGQPYEVQYRKAYEGKIYTDKDGKVLPLSVVEDTAQFLRNVRTAKKKVFFIGNGGSAGIAVHMTADFLKNGRMRTIDMYGAATITCLGNDYGYEHIFSKQLELLADVGDVLIAISSSGNSPNILLAADVMKKCGGTVVTMTGFQEVYISQ